MVNEMVLNKDELLEIRGDNCKYEDIRRKVEVRNIRIPNISKDEKEKYVDLLVHYKNEYIDIELNNNATGDYFRNACYIARVITSYLVGESYDKVTQGILVNLNWFRDNELNKYPAQVVEEIWNYPSLRKDKPNYFIKFINVNLYSFKEMRYNEVKERDMV